MYQHHLRQLVTSFIGGHLYDLKKAPRRNPTQAQDTTLFYNITINTQYSTEWLVIWIEYLFHLGGSVTCLIRNNPDDQAPQELIVYVTGLNGDLQTSSGDVSFGYKVYW